MKLGADIRWLVMWIISCTGQCYLHQFARVSLLSLPFCSSVEEEKEVIGSFRLLLTSLPRNKLGHSHPSDIHPLYYSLVYAGVFSLIYLLYVLLTFPKSHFQKYVKVSPQTECVWGMERQVCSVQFDFICLSRAHFRMSYLSSSTSHFSQLYPEEL